MAMRMALNNSRVGLVVLPVDRAGESTNAAVGPRRSYLIRRDNRPMVFIAGHFLIDRLPSAAHITSVERHLKSCCSTRELDARPELRCRENFVVKIHAV